MSAGCRVAPSGGGQLDAPSSVTAGVPQPVDSDGGPAHVRLSWRLYETQRWLEGRGTQRESAVVQLLVSGGVPMRVDLGRRDTAGCAVHRAPTAAGPEAEGILTSVDCRAAQARVSRPIPDELHVVASDSPERGHIATGTVRIPAHAEIEIDSDLPRIPDEALSP